MPSSFDLIGATGALFGSVAAEQDGRSCDIVFAGQKYWLNDKVAVSDMQLREWFGKLSRCWPTRAELHDGGQIPANGSPKTYKPDCGLQLIGDVGEGEGFVISWDGGWVRGTASGCLIAFAFDNTRDDLKSLKKEMLASRT